MLRYFLLVIAVVKVMLIVLMIFYNDEKLINWANASFLFAYPSKKMKDGSYR